MSKTVVTQLSQNDVLLGRGAFTVNYVGNVIFREMCKQVKHKYSTAAKRKDKTNIAKQVVNDVLNRGGRFLVHVSDEEAKKHGVTDGTKAWFSADTETAINKAKQTLRDREYQPKVKKAYLQKKPEATAVCEIPISSVSIDLKAGSSSSVGITKSRDQSSAADSECPTAEDRIPSPTLQRLSFELQYLARLMGLHSFQNNVQHQSTISQKGNLRQHGV